MGRILIVSGMSGAGKTVALKHLEDIGYYCVDNLPVSLLENFVEISLSNSSNKNKIALGIDVRHENEFGDFKKILAKWDKSNTPYSLAFLDANNDVLVRRFKENRREHPLSKNTKKASSILNLIELEREKMKWLKKKADIYICTNDFKIGDLKKHLENIFCGGNKLNKLNIKIIAFGYKNGIPIESDMVYDVRFLPNPYYDVKLRSRTGLVKSVRDYISKDGIYTQFKEKLFDLIDFELPYFEKEGRDNLIISIGCTGGHHRSVSCAKDLYNHIKNLKKYLVNVEYRDIKR